MRLLHIVPTYLPALRYGGPIHSVHALCKGLAALGHDVHVLTTSVDGAADSEVPHNRPLDIDGVNVHYCHSRWLRRLYWSPEFSARCSTLVDAVDAVHLHSVFLYPTWAGARAAARLSVPYILSPRGMLVRQLIEQRSPIAKRVWIELIEKRNLKKAAAIHVTSGEELRALSDLDCALAPVVVIPNGVARPETFAPGAVSTDVRALITQGFDILSFGRISWKKALDRLVHALVDLPNSSAVIAGNDDEGEMVRLRDLAAERGVLTRLRFIPRQIVGADKEALFAAARVFVLPSLSENFGNVVVEAMARGLPVVVTDSVGSAELVAVSNAGLVTSNSAEAFAQGVKELLRSDQALAAYGAAGAAYANRNLGWDRVASRFADLYHSLSTPNACWSLRTA